MSALNYMELGSHLSLRGHVFVLYHTRTMGVSNPVPQVFEKNFVKKVILNDKDKITVE